MDPLLPDDPQALGSYRLLGRIGAGGMGRVYLARSTGGRTVAVKVVRPDLAQDTAFRGRFRQEVEIARAVSGRYTAPVVDADTEAALPWLATAFVLGPSLTEVVDGHGALPEHSVRALGAGLAVALTEIHSVGLVHRDLKPSNVLLAADGPRVIDFGIARAVDGDRMTQTGVVVGSPGYIPPEQALGQAVGTAGDIFALGAVLAYASTGRTAYGDTTPAAVLYQVVHGEPDLTGVPESLLGLLTACLDRDPARRPTPQQVSEALAPQGTGAVFTNWLPGAVASTIATHAARILDLETPEQGTAAVPGHGAPPSAPGYGTSSPAYGTPAPGHGTPAPGHGTPAPAAASGTPAPSPGGTPPGDGYVPTYVPSGATPPPGAPTAPVTVASASTVASAAADAPAPSRRRFLGLAAGAAAGVAAVGGAGIWMLGGKDKDRGDGKGAAADGQEPGGAQQERFSTPPPGTAPQVLWHRTAETDTLSSDQPLLAHNGLLLISGDPLVARHALTGKAKWTRKEVAPPGAPLILAAGTLFFVSTEYDGDVIGLDPDTGKEVWRSRLNGALTVEHILAADEHRIYVIASVRTKDTTVHLTAIAALNIRTGKPEWQKPRDKGTMDYDLEGVAVDGRLVYTDSRRNVTVRDAANGRQLWTKKIGDDIAWRPAVHARRIFLGGDRLRAVHLDNGKPDWSMSTGGRLSFYQPMVVGQVLYVADHSGGVWAVDPVRGKKLWLCEDAGAHRAPTEFVLVGEALYGASYDDGGGIFALDPKTGKARWNYNDNAGIEEQWHVVASGRRLLATHGDEIYALPAV
ncbi:serine/threonine protein kinase [Streptomyces inhibens]|uniref:Serine/threonine protein kinase n=1 Tax=Streptomyces inhibens TaxID=2293571 RepID=A0A371PQC3_STRIH|nr:serine/threonine-protein kinase [Streptomyces inhibens]REK84726.1 serine/threonine protein kinase [Streptomyces inhibens]